MVEDATGLFNAYYVPTYPTWTPDDLKRIEQKSLGKYKNLESAKRAVEDYSRLGFRSSADSPGYGVYY